MSTKEKSITGSVETGLKTANKTASQLDSALGPTTLVKAYNDLMSSAESIPFAGDVIAAARGMCEAPAAFAGMLYVLYQAAGWVSVDLPSATVATLSVGASFLGTFSAGTLINTACQIARGTNPLSPSKKSK